MALFKELTRRVDAGQDEKAVCKEALDAIKAKKIPIEAMSLREMAMSVKTKTGESLFEYLMTHPVPDSGIVSEALNTSMFPALTGALLQNEIIQSYDEVPDTLGMLVRQVRPTEKNPEFPAIDSENAIEEVPEGTNYPIKIDVTEQTAGMRERKVGEIVELTKEAVMFDRTAQLLDKARQFGRDMANDRQKRIAAKITDADTNVLYKNGSAAATALWTATAFAKNTWPIATVIENNGLVKGTDALKEVRENANGFMQKKDRKGNRINPIRGNAVLLCRPDDETRALTIRASFNVPGTANNDVNIFSAGGVRGGYEIVTSPFLFDTSKGGNAITAQGDWYYGWFKEQFAEAIWWDTQVTNQSGDTSDLGFERDIIHRWKISRAYDIFATDYQYVIKNTAN